MSRSGREKRSVGNRDTGEVLRKYGVVFQLHLFQRHTTVPTRHWGVFQECPRDTKGVFQVSHKHREMNQECPRDTGESTKSVPQTQRNVGGENSMSVPETGEFTESVPETQGSAPSVSQRHREVYQECPRDTRECTNSVSET